MPDDTDDSDLLAIEVATHLVLTESGRILHENDPDRSAGPRLSFSGCKSGNIVRIRHDVGEKTALAIEALVAKEPPLRDPDSTPLHLDDYDRLLTSEAPVEQRRTGLIYCFLVDFGYEHDVTLVRSDTPDADRFIGGLTADHRMLQALEELGFATLAELWAPWCIALHQDQIASVAITARIGPTGAAVGISTVGALRGHGFAAAATAGWASHPSLRERSLFYGTDRTNVSSQRVTARLGLHFIGASIRLT